MLVRRGCSAAQGLETTFASIDGLIASRHDGVGASGQGLLAPQNPYDEAWAWRHDPMDLDYDSELAAWIGSWGLPVEDATAPAASVGGLGPGLAGRIVPDDFLFPDDEAALAPHHGGGARLFRAEPGGPVPGDEPEGQRPPPAQPPGQRQESGPGPNGSEKAAVRGPYELGESSSHTSRDTWRC